MVKRLLLAAAALAFLIGAIPIVAPAQVISGIVVSACGTPGSTYTVGRAFPFTLDPNGNQCLSGPGGILTVTDPAAEASLAALVAAINTPIPSNKACQTTATAQSSLLCGAPAVALIDFSVVPDATIAASGYKILIVDSATVPGAGVVAFKKCYTIPSSYGAISYGGTFGAGGVTMTAGLAILISTGADCQTYTPSAHATAIMASYQ